MDRTRRVSPRLDKPWVASARLSVSAMSGPSTGPGFALSSSVNLYFANRYMSSDESRSPPSKQARVTPINKRLASWCTLQFKHGRRDSALSLVNAKQSPNMAHFFNACSHSVAMAPNQAWQRLAGSGLYPVNNEAVNQQGLNRWDSWSDQCLRESMRKGARTTCDGGPLASI